MRIGLRRVTNLSSCHLEGNIWTSDIRVVVPRVLPTLVRSVVKGRTCIGLWVASSLTMVDVVCVMGRMKNNASSVRTFALNFRQLAKCHSYTVIPSSTSSHLLWGAYVQRRVCFRTSSERNSIKRPGIGKPKSS